MREKDREQFLKGGVSYDQVTWRADLRPKREELREGKGRKQGEETTSD